MQQHEQNHQQQQSRWRPTGRQLLWVGSITALLFLIIVFCGYLFAWKWTGLVAHDNYQRRTLWDWLGLLIVPVVLSIGGYLFTRSESRATRDVAEQRAQDEALQAYLDKMTELLLDRCLRKSRQGDDVRTVAWARTKTVLRRLRYGKHKGIVLRFVYESGLIYTTCPVFKLAAADLSNADLRGSYLHNVNLEGAVLTGAMLSGAELPGANLRGTDLRNAELRGSDLTGADFGVAKERKKAADLTGADLSDAKGITNEELKHQAFSLRGATMPNGQKYEEWLKDKVGDDQ